MLNINQYQALYYLIIYIRNKKRRFIFESPFFIVSIFIEY